MGVTVTPIAAEPLWIKCRICGRKAPRGTKLCEQCKAALKRARQVPTVVSQFLPLAISGADSGRRRDSGHRRVSPAPRSSWFATPAVPGTLGACAAIAIFGAAVAVTGYFAVQEIEDEPDRVGAVAVETRGPVAAPRAPSALETRAADAVVAPISAELNETGPDAHVAAARALAPLPVAPKPYARIARADAKVARSAVPSSEARPQTPSTESEATQVPPDEAAGSASTANLAPAAIEDAPSVPDRWQAMNAELARCARDNFIAGVLCDQRTRWQYCEGYWGHVPQCRVASRVDGGR